MKFLSQNSTYFVFSFNKCHSWISTLAYHQNQNWLCTTVSTAILTISNKSHVAAKSVSSKHMKTTIMLLSILIINIQFMIIIIRPEITMKVVISWWSNPTSAEHQGWRRLSRTVPTNHYTTSPSHYEQQQLPPSTTAELVWSIIIWIFSLVAVKISWKYFLSVCV